MGWTSCFAAHPRARERGFPRTSECHSDPLKSGHRSPRLIPRQTGAEPQLDHRFAGSGQMEFGCCYLLGLHLQMIASLSWAGHLPAQNADAGAFKGGLLKNECSPSEGRSSLARLNESAGTCSKSRLASFG